MMHSIKKIATGILFFATVSVSSMSCKKDKHIPPTVNFKTGTGYTSNDGSAARNSTIKVGIIADKVEDDMLTYNVSYAYDGAATTVTNQTFTLAGTEQQHYDKDVTFNIRNQAGTEKWTFTITDKDGNIAQKQITFTVL